MKKFILVALLLTSCASSPDKIATSYVSPMQYSEYNCKQLGMEMERINRRVGELYGRLDKEAGADTAQMAVGLILFWPALFLLEGGDGPEAQEYARLKGEMEAIETVAIQKECNLTIPKFEAPKSNNGEPAHKAVND